MHSEPNNHGPGESPSRSFGVKSGIAAVLGLTLAGSMLAFAASSATAAPTTEDPVTDSPSVTALDPATSTSGGSEAADPDMAQALSEDPEVIAQNPIFGPEFVKKITLCHRTGDWKMPYVEITVSRWAIVRKDGSPNTDKEKGHGGHLGKPYPLDDPWGDIIPAFDPIMHKNGKVWAGYDGLNTGEYGKYILANNCQLKPTLEVGMTTVKICHQDLESSTLPYGTGALSFDLKLFRLKFFKDVYTPWKIMRNKDFIEHYGHTGAVWPGADGVWGDIIPPLDKWDIKVESDGDGMMMMDSPEMEELMKRPDYAAGLNYNDAGIAFLGRNCQRETTTSTPTPGTPSTTVVTVPGPTVSATATVTATPSAAATPTATPVITPAPATSPTAEPVIVTPEAATAPTAVNAGDGSSTPQSGLPLWAMALAAVAAIGAAGASVRLASKKH